MNTLQRWLQAPQTHWLRKLLFQLHLWMGIGFGLYVLLVSLSGSALLLKSSFYSWFEPKYIEPTTAIAMEGAALDEKIAEIYSDYEVSFVFPAYEKGRATYVVLKRGGIVFPHYFNQFTGADMGIANPWPIKAVEQLSDVHDDLLMGSTGRKINGVGGLIFVLMSISGIVIWWQGRSRWYEGLLIWPNPRRKFIWQLHSFIGFWFLLLMLAWGISGFQFAFPRYLNVLVNWLDNDPTDFDRPDSWLRLFRSIHVARLGEGPWARRGWIIASFIPTLIFVSGFILWWRRVVRPARPQNQA